ncbi:probable S-adenosylmethionine-dependent methyltransferase CRG1 [Bufo gargarizans]|uniref:probable S-adenosylmethionine-dependent methyltransferase CRG1 n=1 Tax=Bufo gargarizans TaxID=30331 RepID=UPI001CF5BF45|nr:probable S-adenosylmethionine-dependent methyltransferase CRG1 [Bufo gargarizans]
MAVQLFKKTAFSSVYQKYMTPVSNEVINILLSYVKRKTNGQPLEMLVDVGCGTGRYTLPLAPHFKNVLGIDMSESQINLAKQSTSANNNVSYMVASAEKIPVKNDSVDLVHAGLAAHWFTIDKFLNESVRVLKTNGCLALHAVSPDIELEYKDLSRDLNAVMSKVRDTLFQYFDETTGHMLCQYQNIYEAIPLKDKELITDIPDTVQLSIPEFIGFIQSIYMYQTFMEKDVKGAKHFLTQTEKRCREILGEEADSVRLNMHLKHYCALACKH